MSAGRTLGIDASSQQANASLKTLVRRDSGQDYQQSLDGMLRATGVQKPTAADRQRLRRRCATATGCTRTTRTRE